MSYKEDVDFLKDRVEVLMRAMVSEQARNRGAEDGETIEELYERFGGSVHAIFVVTPSDPPAPEDHLSFRWFKVKGGVATSSEDRMKLDGCDCDRCGGASGPGDGCG